MRFPLLGAEAAEVKNPPVPEQLSWSQNVRRSHLRSPPPRQAPSLFSTTMLIVIFMANSFPKVNCFGATVAPFYLLQSTKDCQHGERGRRPALAANPRGFLLWPGLCSRSQPDHSSEFKLSNHWHFEHMSHQGDFPDIHQVKYFLYLFTMLLPAFPRCHRASDLGRQREPIFEISRRETLSFPVVKFSISKPPSPPVQDSWG